jgi:dTDP-4-dehydrorhamnose 3,5-epimerase
MRFTETELPGAFIIDAEPIADERGYFTRMWAASELERRGLDPHVAQCNLSWNRTKGTLRGLHFQRGPFAEVKTVQCMRGSFLDVIVDLRPASSTFCRWTAVELSAEVPRILYVPKGFAHGYLTLTDDVQAYYQVSTPFAPEHASGVPWDDPAFDIRWPFPPTTISAKDRSWPAFDRSGI